MIEAGAIPQKMRAFCDLLIRPYIKMTTDDAGSYVGSVDEGERRVTPLPPFVGRCRIATKAATG